MALAMVTCEYSGCAKFHEWFKCNDPIPFKRCAKCKSVYYCSKECQVADWQLHKLCCIPGVIGCDYSATIKDVLSRPVPENKCVMFEMIPDHALKIGDLFHAVPFDSVMKKAIASKLNETNTIIMFKRAIIGVSVKIEELGLKTGHVLNIRGLFILISESKKLA